MQTYSSAVNSELFVEFVKKLVDLRHKEPMALFMDGAKFHTSKFTREQLKLLNVRVIMNVSYHPQYNPIEGCFSVVKKHFKRKRLNELANGQCANLQKAINNSFQ